MGNSGSQVTAGYYSPVVTNTVPSNIVTPQQTYNRGRGGARGHGRPSSRGGQGGHGGQNYRNRAVVHEEIPALIRFKSMSLNSPNQNRNEQINRDGINKSSRGAQNSRGGQNSRSWQNSPDGQNSHGGQNSRGGQSTRGGQSIRGGQNRRGGQTPRLKFSEVNMPTGQRISVTIPARPNCRCATPNGNLKLITLRPEGNLGKREYAIIATEMKETIKVHKLQEHGGGRFQTFEIDMIQKVVNCCVWKKFREVQQEIADEVGYVNEKMLFHGTLAADSIVQVGFDKSKAKPSGMFGAGIYFAQHSSKSNQYVYGYLGGNGCPRHSDKNCYTCVRKMLLCRVTLGKSHRMTSASSYLRPPLGYNSIEGLATESGGSLQYPEYVVYRGEQAYPEYLISYKIKK